MVRVSRTPGAHRCRSITSRAARARALSAPRQSVAGSGESSDGHGGDELGGDLLHHRVEQGLLAGDVVVERHRLDAELLADPPHRDRRDPLGVRHVHRGPHDALAAERQARGASRVVSLSTVSVTGPPGRRAVVTNASSSAIDRLTA